VATVPEGAGAGCAPGEFRMTRTAEFPTNFSWPQFCSSIAYGGKNYKLSLAWSFCKQ
jgi:hypothetical protein